MFLINIILMLTTQTLTPPSPLSETLNHHNHSTDPHLLRDSTQ